MLTEDDIVHKCGVLRLQACRRLQSFLRKLQRLSRRTGVNAHGIFRHNAFHASQGLSCSGGNNIYASIPYSDLEDIAGYSPALGITLSHHLLEGRFSFVLVGGKGFSLVPLTVLRFSLNRGLSPPALPEAADVALRHRVARHCWRSRLLSNHFRCRRPSTRPPATKQAVRHRVARHCWRSRLVSNQVQCRRPSTRPTATNHAWLSELAWSDERS